MASQPKNSLTKAEWNVMRIVWDHGSCAAREVVAAGAAQHDWAPSTVKTLLRRLVEKGHLKATRVGNSFLYEPRRTALRSLCQAADDLLSHASSGTQGSLLAHMVKRSKLSAEELSELRSLLDSKKKGRRR